MNNGLLTREEAQQRYFQGGTIGGHTLHKLNLDRLAILQALTGLDSIQLTALGFTVYALSEEQAGQGAAVWTKEGLEVEAAKRGVGKLELADVTIFSQALAMDMDAISASEATTGAPGDIEPDGLAEALPDVDGLAEGVPPERVVRQSDS